MKGLILTSAAILGSGFGLSAYLQQDEIDRRVPAAREGIVAVRVPSGSVEIAGWDGDEVRVTGKLEDGDERLELIGEHGHVEIRVLPSVGADAKADLRIRVPRGSSVDVESGDATVRVDGIEGVVRLASETGDLFVDGRPTGIVARSAAGDIEISSDETPGIAHSERGVVRLTGRRPEIVTDVRAARRLREQARRRGRDWFGDREGDARWQERGERLGELGAALGVEVASLVSDILEDVDIDVDVEDYGDGFRFSVDGDLRMSRDELDAMFADLGRFFEGFSEDLSEEMAELGADLEEIGREIEREYRERRDRRGR